MTNESMDDLKDVQSSENGSTSPLDVSVDTSLSKAEVDVDDVTSVPESRKYSVSYSNQAQQSDFY